MYGIQGNYIIAGQYYMKYRAILNIGQYNTVLSTEKNIVRWYAISLI